MKPLWMSFPVWTAKRCHRRGTWGWPHRSWRTIAAPLASAKMRRSEPTALSSKTPIGAAPIISRNPRIKPLSTAWKPITTLCFSELDYARGDDFLQIGRANAEAARRILRRRLDGLTGVGFSLQLGSLFLSSLVAPIAQWLNPTRSQGDLRARASNRASNAGTSD